MSSSGNAEPLATEQLVGEVASDVRSALLAALPTVLDPGSAKRTLHWGRNYLWVADVPGVGEVVVKQFRHESWRARLRKRQRGSKARGSFTIARALQAAGIPTPEPLLWVDSRQESGPSWYLCRLLQDGLEARYPLRALNAGTLATDFPQVGAEELIAAAATVARQLHEKGFWHRDLSAGNLLLRRDGSAASTAAGPSEAAASSRAETHAALVAWLIDLNRCRQLRRVSLAQRLRDLARLSLFRRADQDLLLHLYFDGQPPPGAAVRYRLFHASFHGRHRLKNRLRGKTSAPSGPAKASRGGILTRLRRRRAYPHLPPPPTGAGSRDLVVWDRLSDQPHQHAGGGSKLLVRLRDAPTHLRSLAVALAAAPRIARRYRQLVGAPSHPVAMDGIGVAVRPHPEDPAALLAALDDLGVRHVLLRLHPWEDDHSAEEALARELHARGRELVFTLPQRRELVRDLPRWRAAVRELGARFAPYGRTFQLGQAWNRSKWGVWTLGELQQLLAVAAEELLVHPGVELVGPGVIDFEPYATASAVNWPGLGVRFSALASLLYVDRRGAPESTQLGFDAAGKAALVRAIAETSRWCGPASWVTEVNWPLREGPHSPAGRDVSVDEATAARYLPRFYLPVLGRGYAERVYWWQLVARGYGLAVAEPAIDGRPGSLRRRPAFAALATLQRLVGGATCEGTLPSGDGCHLHRFTTAAGGELIAGWASGAPTTVELPWRPAALTRLLGEPGEVPAGPQVRLDGDVQYFSR